MPLAARVLGAFLLTTAACSSSQEPSGTLPSVGGSASGGSNAGAPSGGVGGSAQAGATSGGASGSPSAAGAGAGGAVGGAGGSGGAAGASGNGGTAGTSGGHCKRGIGVNDVSDADLQALAPGVSWFYDWGATLPASLGEGWTDTGLEFAPMVWGGEPNVAATIAQVPAGARYLLAFNEPNFRTQGNLSAATAAAHWPKVEEIAAAKGLEIVGPAVNFCGPEAECWDTDPFSYLDDFFAACPGCRVDYVAVHWYACDLPALEWFLDQAKKYEKPLWLTELNCPGGNASAQLAYMKAALPVLEADPMVFRYAWFMARSTVPEINLLAGPGELTSLGQEYVSAPGASECTR